MTDRIIRILSERFPGQQFRVWPGGDRYFGSSAGTAWTSRPPANATIVHDPFVVDGIYLRRMHETTDDSGHRYVSAPGKYPSMPLHRFLLECFVGACPEGMEGCHYDDDPANNRIENLRWDTRSNNARDAFRNGHKVLGESHEQAKLTVSNIEEAMRLRVEGMSYARIGRRFGVTMAAMYNAINGITWRLSTKDVVRPSDLPRRVYADQRGEKSPSARLTDAAVREIRRRHDAGRSIASLAREFDASQSAVRRAVRRESWAHI